MWLWLRLWLKAMTKCVATAVVAAAESAQLDVTILKTKHSALRGLDIKLSTYEIWKWRNNLSNLMSKYMSIYIQTISLKTSLCNGLSSCNCSLSDFPLLCEDRAHWAPIMLWIFGDLQILYVNNLLLKTPGSELTRVLGHREASPLPYHTDQETEDEKKKISARFLRQSDPFLGYFELD